ncbi:hypothetical protein [Steroidobacter sp.]|uniref:hypothetical protein n=1 Tax=Steroidobacter sp. TaxID=1978227 RepID=UPI001A3A0580|nr:hypothetical protein [Steroidobacter sp.]MBL8268317.1 hypothetical protein [Steroidobacter sp.]
MNQSSVPGVVVSRVAAGLLGSYVWTWGALALLIVVLSIAGMDFEDAESLGGMLAILMYLSAFLWAFSAASLPRVWGVLAGGGVLMAAAASLAQSALLRSLGG